MRRDPFMPARDPGDRPDPLAKKLGLSPEGESSDVVERLEAAIPGAPNHDLLRCSLDAIRALEATNATLQEACEFYADPETWARSTDSIYVTGPLGRDRDTAADGSDCPGAKARRALKE